LDYFYFVYPCPAMTLRGSNFIVVFLILCFTLCPLETKWGVYFFF
jgi:hypothetical protein